VHQLKVLATKVVSVAALAGGLLTVATTGGAEARGHAPVGHSFQGYSHHYGDHLHGRRTASGQPHDKFKLTAAHKSLPFGTHLQVTNTKNGKSCVVVVNDRGPYGSPNLVLDVSKAAAHVLGFPGGGKIPIACKVVDPKDGALKAFEEHDKVKAYKASAKGGNIVASAPAKAAEKATEKPAEKVAEKAPVVQAKPVTTPAATAVATVPMKLHVPQETVAALPKSPAAPVEHKAHVETKPPVHHHTPAEAAQEHHPTFLLVINEPLENIETPQHAKTVHASYKASAHSAPTVFIPMSNEGAAQNAVAKPQPKRSIADGNILM